MPTEFEKTATLGQNTGFLMVKSAEVKNSKRGPYLDLLLCDKSGEINGKIWEYSPEKYGRYNPGDIVKVKGTVEMWNNTAQLKVERIRHATDADGLSVEDFVPSAQFSGKEIMSKIKETVSQFKDPDYAALVNGVIDFYGDRVLISSAATRMHHAIRGGLMMHTFSMMKTATAICDVYPFLNRDLVLSGVIIHDLAKVDELNISEEGVANEYTPKGNLIGHLVMGAVNVVKVGESLNIPQEKIQLLEHIVLSHHGCFEFGSPVLPMFPEAMVVSVVDSLDADLFQMQSALSGVEKGQCTGKIYSLDRKLYRAGDDTEYYIKG